MKRSLSALLAVSAIAISTNAAALSNSARVPVLLYHSGVVDNPCDYGHYASVALQQEVPVRGYYDGVWQGHGDFLLINNYASESNEVVPAATYIQSKIGVWPDLFAYPYGNRTPDMVNYFWNNWSEHRTYAAFTTDPQYLSRGQDRYQLPRFVWQRDWTSPAQFNALLDAASY